MKLGKKGTMIDMFYLMIVFLVFGIMILISMYVADAVMPQLTTVFGAGDATNVINTARAGYGMMDYMFMFIYFAMIGIPILFAVLVRNNPIFFVINIILLIIFILITPTFSNIMHEFWSSEAFAPYALGGAGGSFTFPIMTRLFQYLPLISVTLSIALMIAMFAKGGSERAM